MTWGFLLTGPMDAAAAFPFAGSTSSKAKCIFPKHKQRNHNQGLPQRSKAPTAQPNASRTHRNTDSPIPSSSWASRHRKSLMWVYTWHSPTLWVPSSPAGHPCGRCQQIHTCPTGIPHCSYPQISAQTFHPPDTPSQNWGLLLVAGEFNLEFSGKCPWPPVLGAIQTLSVPAASTR